MSTYLENLVETILGDSPKFKVELKPYDEIHGFGLRHGEFGVIVYVPVVRMNQFNQPMLGTDPYKPGISRQALEFALKKDPQFGYQILTRMDERDVHKVFLKDAAITTKLGKNMNVIIKKPEPTGSGSGSIASNQPNQTPTAPPTVPGQSRPNPEEERFANYGATQPPLPRTFTLTRENSDDYEDPRLYRETVAGPSQERSRRERSKSRDAMPPLPLPKN